MNVGLRESMLQSIRAVGRRVQPHLRREYAWLWWAPSVDPPLALRFRSVSAAGLDETQLDEHLDLLGPSGRQG